LGLTIGASYFEQLSVTFRFMGTKLAVRSKRRRAISVPVTTIEEIPDLSNAERASLLADLKQAEGRIKAGKGFEYHPKAFKDRLLKIYRGGKK
jgi:hypothetical protein